MRKLLLPLVGLLAFAVGCRTLDALNPFSDPWVESPNYIPIDYDTAWTIIKSQLFDWEIEVAERDDGEIETRWKVMSQYRLKVEVRLDEVEQDGQQGVRFELRVQRQRPKKIWSPVGNQYDEWVNEDPDKLRQDQLLMRFNNKLREAIRLQEQARSAGD